MLKQVRHMVAMLFLACAMGWVGLVPALAGHFMFWPVVVVNVLGLIGFWWLVQFYLRLLRARRAIRQRELNHAYVWLKRERKSLVRSVRKLKSLRSDARSFLSNNLREQTNAAYRREYKVFHQRVDHFESSRAAFLTALNDYQEARLLVRSMRKKK